MIIVATFIVVVFLYSLFSRRLDGTVITAPIIFTCAGVLLILAVPSLHELDVERESILKLAELGLVMLLFTDASHIDLKTVPTKQRLPLRLLTVGMLLTILLGAVVGCAVFPDLTVWEAGIVAAILAPTDAGLGQVIVESERVPLRIRQALGVEAGLNDGLSVPFLMCFIAVSRAGTEGGGQVFLKYIAEQLGMGAVVGAAIGLIGGYLLGYANRKEWMAESLQQLGLVSLPFLSILACHPVGGSPFIAAYVAGLLVQIGFKDADTHSSEFAEGWGQLFDYFIFFFFGMVVVFHLGHFNVRHLLYALLSLTVVRMLPVAISLIGTGLSSATVLFMGWFGPRGLASIVLGLVFLEEEARLPGEETIKLTVIVTVMLSIMAHGFSALPGIDRYARKVEGLGAATPERQG
ncbi:cation:proton antiporter [Geomonas sp.]|uniref:cation:proton antiporter n=1 Tax=Geomonas sp. TaxID=2651584 RepID=UPI002B48B2CD|nr:cation:proton antiporter [Geomonas sp.]HJV36323.1 cation:proton antiporter [Geomonas sp.]